jgi:SAM-dependent methyltransferase
MENLLRNSAWLYDVDNRDNLTDDIQFYVDYAKNLKCANILELGCGTGRVSLALAIAGFNVTGLDLSNEVLDVFRQKLDNTDNNTKHRIEIIHGNMANFELNKPFDLIIVPFRAFQCLADDNDIEKSLTSIRNHLTDRGIFIVNVFNPNPDRMNENWCCPEKIQWELLDEKTGNYVVKKYSQDKIDLENRVMYITFIYEVKDKADNTSEIKDKLKLKYYYSHQLRAEVEKSGLEVAEEYSWYDKSPPGGREIILICRRRT